ncbi:hypothetical protein DPMN_011845 [Dreissena polymorpha]|uniref:Secreted protein n=1 Tax=Dreissena polymorpha TaxID=45954 RepID=A0A9D4N1B6_DREPO|nr:hypothetical protein DPMN_011845 [Dreissena polymorpha]
MESINTNTAALTLVLLSSMFCYGVNGMQCIDESIWLEGRYECRLLTEVSPQGFHLDPNYWCNVYPLTRCCATCDRLRQRGLLRRRQVWGDGGTLLRHQENNLHRHLNCG